MSGSLLFRTASNTMIMDICRSRARGLYKMRYPKSVTIYWHYVDAVLMLYIRSVHASLTLIWWCSSIDSHDIACKGCQKLRLWINAVAQSLGSTRCNRSNHWRSVDAHFQTGVVTIWRSLLPRTDANTLIMGTCHSRALGFSMIQKPKLLTLCWQCVDAVLMLCWQSVDALLTLSLTCSSIDTHDIT
jgi:hypothetical protein